MQLAIKIKNALNKFNLDLKGLNVLTEAATGNYVITPVIAAAAGANVFAFTKSSKYGSVDEVKNQTFSLAKQFNVEQKIQIITNLDEIDLSAIHILTNTGFLRPINKDLVNKLSSQCVIPLMWEPWEFRPGELDLDACAVKGLKVYGTNESDERLKTMQYIGYIVLHFLLAEKYSPFSANILLLADEKFGKSISEVLKQNNFKFNWVTDYNNKKNIPDNFNVVICAEHSDNTCLIGENGFIVDGLLSPENLIIHISGNVDLKKTDCKKIPERAAEFGYMSFTTDFIDSSAVVDLHTAGLKVAEGMRKANDLKITGREYKNFIEKNYPALAFDNEKYW